MAGLLDDDILQNKFNIAVGGLLNADISPAIKFSSGAYQEAVNRANALNQLLNGNFIPYRSYQNAALNNISPESFAAFDGGMAGVISKEAKARLIQDLTRKKYSGDYILGDITDGQLGQFNKYYGTNYGNEIPMTRGLFNHLIEKRINKDGYSPQQVADFFDYAMRKNSQFSYPDGSVKTNKYPYLENTNAVDGVSKKRFDSKMPLINEADSLIPSTVSPDGLRPVNPVAKQKRKK